MQDYTVCTSYTCTNRYVEFVPFHSCASCIYHFHVCLITFQWHEKYYVLLQFGLWCHLNLLSAISLVFLPGKTKCVTFFHVSKTMYSPSEKVCLHQKYLPKTAQYFFCWKKAITLFRSQSSNLNFRYFTVYIQWFGLDMKEIARNCLSNITCSYPCKYLLPLCWLCLCDIHHTATTEVLLGISNITQPQLRFCWAYQTLHCHNWGSVGDIKHHTATTEILLVISNIAQPQLRFCLEYQTSHSHNGGSVGDIKHRTATTEVLFGMAMQE